MDKIDIRELRVGDWVKIKDLKYPIKRKRNIHLKHIIMNLIDKSAVVAEIYRLRDFANDRWDIEEVNGVDKFLDKLIPHINTLESKEVDLENEITDYINRHYHIRYDETLERGNDPLTTWDFNEIAKHFFELGLKQSSSDEVKIGESQIYLNDDGGEPPYDGKQWLDLSCTEYEIPSDKFQDGDKIEFVIRKIKIGEE
jgi:hypothetical protein